MPRQESPNPPWQIAFYAFTRSKPSLLHHAATMPRTPLGTIDGNRRRGFELSEALRLRIAGAAENGVSPADISRNYKIPYDSVRATLPKTQSSGAFQAPE